MRGSALTTLVRGILLVGLGLFTVAAAGRDATARGSNDLAFLAPWFTPTGGDRETLATRGVVVRGLPARGKQIGVIAACGIAISPDAFAARMRAAWDVERGEFAAGRLGKPPNPADLERLSLDDGDIDRLRRCRAGDCRLNLSKSEISAVGLALGSPAASSVGVQQVFRDIIVNRARRYQSGGLEALPDYHDRSEPVRPAAIFAEILSESHYLTDQLPRLVTYLQRFPETEVRPDDSFLHWSKVIMNGKAVVRVTHIAVFRPGAESGLPAVVVAGKQVYASRYMNGELTLTMLFTDGGGQAYLVHVDRSDLDELGGAFSGLKRSLIEGRIKSEATGALAALRDRLERGR